MNVLLTGPPSSGKSRAALERFLAQSRSLLIVPTATMAEHQRNSLARAGVAVRPQSVQTLAGFLNEWSPKKEAPAALIHLLIERALEKLKPRRFRSVADQPGFVRALLKTFEDANPARLTGELAALYSELREGLAVRGRALRVDRFAAAELSGGLPEHIVFDGFFTLSDAEAGLVRNLSKHAQVTATLPDWAGAARAREGLLSAGFEERRLSDGQRTSRQVVFAAPTVEREVEEIARRILEHVDRGRAFREIGIVLRTRDPYAPLVETTLARFGIPARFYFQDSLASHPAIACISGVVRAMLTGWDHELLLSALRVPVSGIGATVHGDQLDFEWRKKLPGAGMPLPTPVESLQAMDAWRRDRVSAQEWAARIKGLRKLIPEPKVENEAERSQVNAWRSTAVALAAFVETLAATAEVLNDSGSLTLAEFWKQATLTLNFESLRVSDARRNVVHVMDAYEARQWELPVVFVCGLTERLFPQYHREDPILPRETASERHIEEQFLFEIAKSRATEETILSYPRFDEAGAKTLRSSFLGDLDVPDCGIRVRPRPSRVPGIAPASGIRDPELVARLGTAHPTLSPTSLESYLQCPFQFFGRYTLRLRPRPLSPRDRLDALTQGGILHSALAELADAPLLGMEILERNFRAECAKKAIPLTYRTEAIYLEMVRYFSRFLDDPEVALAGWSTRVEEKFQFSLNSQLAIRGRIDRIFIDEDRALVIDYKYSSPNGIKKRVQQTDAGDAAQAGLYMAAAERQFGFVPIGMLFCGLKGEVTWDGWHVPISGLESVGTVCVPEELRGLISSAEQAALVAFESITSGKIAVAPNDPEKCKWCDFREICRAESAGVAMGASS